MPALRYDRFYTYAEITTLLQEFVSAYPTLATLGSMGKSFEGRDIWVLTLTNSATGTAAEKPAYYLEGNIHASEVTTSHAALYAIHYLLSHYVANDDPLVRLLLDTRTVYVVPRLAPDGSEQALNGPQMLRSSVRPYPFPAQEDGLVPEDLDGDGTIVQMRREDPNGEWVASSKDPRIMLRRQPDDYGRTYYQVFTEGRVQNWDGFTVKPAPPLQGLDLNRNYPYDWDQENGQRGAGPYPLSEPETRAHAEFLLAHPNVCGIQSYHTHSGAILRPYAIKGDDAFPVEDLRVYKLLGKKGTELTGYPAISVYHDFRYHPKTVLHGGALDWAYEHLGIFAFSTELWDPYTLAGIENRKFIEWQEDHPEEDDLKLFAWADEHYKEKGFINWHAFDHPQLGKVEIGGWDPMGMFRNAPPSLLEDLCHKHTLFFVAHAISSPKLEISAFTADKQADGLYRLRLDLENSGFLPTYVSKKAQERKLVKPIRVTLALPEGGEVLLGESTIDIGQLEGRAWKVAAGSGAQSSDSGHRSRTEWLVRAPAGTQLGVKATADRAGTVRATVTLA